MRGSSELQTGIIRLGGVPNAGNTPRHGVAVCEIPATWYHTPLPWARCQSEWCILLPGLSILGPAPSAGKGVGWGVGWGDFLKTPSRYSSGSTGLREDRFETGA